VIDILSIGIHTLCLSVTRAIGHTPEVIGYRVWGFVASRQYDRSNILFIGIKYRGNMIKYGGNSPASPSIRAPSSRLYLSDSANDNGPLVHGILGNSNKQYTLLATRNME